MIVIADRGRGQGVRRDDVPPERRAYVTAGTPEQVVDVLRPYIDAGFTGFTFNNAMYRTPEQIATVGELLRMVRPVAAR